MIRVMLQSTVAILVEKLTGKEKSFHHEQNYFYFFYSISVSRHQYRSNWSSYTPSHLDSTLVSNMHKLFSERIEIFSAVEFSKVSILTGIIKISLKVKICNELNALFYLFLFVDVYGMC